MALTHQKGHTQKSVRSLEKLKTRCKFLAADAASTHRYRDAVQNTLTSANFGAHVTETPTPSDDSVSLRWQSLCCHNILYNNICQLGLIRINSFIFGARCMWTRGSSVQRMVIVRLSSQHVVRIWMASQRWVSTSGCHMACAYIIFKCGVVFGFCMMTSCTFSGSVMRAGWSVIGTSGSPIVYLYSTE